MEDFISSGTLELYVLDELTPKERLEVSLMARKNSEVQRELDFIEETYRQLAIKQAVSPSEPNLERIKERLDLEPHLSTWVIKWSFMRIAASIAFITISALSVFQFLELNETSLELSRIDKINQKLNTDLNSQSILNSTLQSHIAIITDPDTREIRLNGSEISPLASSSIFWNTETEEIYLNAEGLPKVPNDRQFQLWAIVDGKPLSIGLVDQNTGLLKMEFVQSASAFAITLEPKGGSQTPTLERMYVLGET